MFDGLNLPNLLNRTRSYVHAHFAVWRGFNSHHQLAEALTPIPVKRRQSALGNNLNKLCKAAELLNPLNHGHGEQCFGVAAHPHGEVGEMSVVVFSPSSFTRSDGRYDTLSTLRHLS